MSLFDTPESSAFLNSRGFYGSDPVILPGSIWLVMNITDENNGTLIQCADEESNVISESTILIFGEHNFSNADNNNIISYIP